MAGKQAWQHDLLGDGPLSIQWLHGWGYNRQGFARVAALFEKTARNRLYDLPGFGKTPMLPEGAGTEEYAHALAEQLEKGQHIIVGHSYGGRVAVQLAARHPEQIKGIILVGGAGLQRKRSLWFKLKASGTKLLGKLARLSDKLFKTRFRDAYVKRFGSADYRNAGALRSTLVSAVTEDLTEQAKQVRCPTLLIYGSNDTDAPPEIGQRYATLIKSAKYVELKGYDHHDILTRGAYQCEALIKKFTEDL